MNNKCKSFISLLLVSLAIVMGLLLVVSHLSKPKENPKQVIVKPNGGKVNVKEKVKDNTSGKTHRIRQVYVPPEGSVTIRPKDPSKSLADVVEIKRKWFGSTIEPGVQVGIITPSFGLDCKIVYFGRLGGVVGFTINPTNMVPSTISPVAGVSYRLDGVSKNWLRNTEGVIEWRPTSRIPWEIGLRINL